MKTSTLEPSIRLPITRENARFVMSLCDEKRKKIATVVKDTETITGPMRIEFDKSNHLYKFLENIIGKTEPDNND